MSSAHHRRRRSTRAFTAGLVATLLTGVAACGAQDPTRPGEAGSTVRIVLTEEPDTLEPCDDSNSLPGLVIRGNVNEPLVSRDPDTGDVKADLATSWEQTTPTTWTFHLRRGVSFSDGTPFTAKTAVYSLKRLMKESLGCANTSILAEQAPEGTATDDYTFVVKTKVADPILPLRLTYLDMVPPSTDPSNKVRTPIGTGPYQLEQWNTGTRIVLTRNPRYWGKRPAYANAEYEWRSDSTVRAAMVVNGEADLALTIGPEDGAGDLAVSYTSNQTSALRMQVDEPPLNDIRVRQAITMSIDREGIVKALLEGGQPAAQLVTPKIDGFNKALKPVYDPDRARKLLAAARADGVDTSRQIRLISRSGLFPRSDEVMQAIAYELGRVGLDVKITTVDTPTALSYQIRPFPEDPGPNLLTIQHGNQIGDPAATMDQYMKDEAPQSTGGTEAFTDEVEKAESLSGAARERAMQQVFADEPEKVAQYAYIAHMEAVVARSPALSYTPSPNSGDQLDLTQMKPRTP